MFAARLDAALEAIANGGGRAEDSGRAFETVHDLPRLVSLFRKDDQAAVNILRDIDRAFAADHVEAAFGAPGEPGDAARIIDLAEALSVAYDEIREWGARARATKPDPVLRPLVQIHAEMLTLASRQLDDYIEAWVALADELPDRLDACGRASEPTTIEMRLVLSVDPQVVAELESELRRLREAA